MALIGYARVSTIEQNEERQLRLFEERKVDRYYLDKMSGKNLDRPNFKKMLEYVREGDTVLVSEFSRLSRNTTDLLNTIQYLTEKGVSVISEKEKLDTTTPQGKLMLTMFAALSQFEREMILERQKEGIRIAKEKGVYKGRPAIPYDEQVFLKECKKWKKGEQTAVETARKIGIKRTRFYSLCKKHGITPPNNKSE